MSNCDKCIFKDVYRDMGASVDVCTLQKDLTMAIAEINFYNQVKCCKSFLDIKQLSTFAKKYPNETKIISEYITTKLNNKEV